MNYYVHPCVYLLGKASTFRVVLAETLPDGVTNAVMMTNPCSPFFKELITSLSSSNRW